jgi:drug/metabolite transporter (DMT)-like permease
MGNVTARGGLAGPALIILAIALFSANDVAMKLLSAGHGAAQVITWRCAVALLLMGPPAAIQIIRAGGMTRARLRLQLIRGALIHCSGLTFFVAFARLPLFDAYVLFFSAPFVTLALVGVMLGERVSRAAWGWATLGFAGVGLALAHGLSGSGDVIGYLAAGAGTFAYAMLMVVTRRLGSETRLAEGMAIPALLGLVTIGPFAALDWTMPSMPDAGLLSLTGALWAGGNLLLAAAIRSASPSRLAPYDFTAMLWAVLYDAVFFATQPGPLELAGAGLVLAACLGHARSDAITQSRRAEARRA